MKRIPLAAPDMPAITDILAYLGVIEASGWQTNFGPLVKGLEEELTKRLGQRCVTVANGTLAIELALLAAGVRKGARVLVPAFTFPATITAIEKVGMKPVFADVDRETWLLMPEMAARFDRQIDAVVPVCAFGAAYPKDAWAGFRVPVVIDAAAAWGNQWPDVRATLCFSLHATKSLGSGEGGAVSGIEAVCAAVQQLSSFGGGGAISGGTNAKMSEYHAAVGLASLRAWEGRGEARRALHTAYRAQLSESIHGLAFQHWQPDWTPTIFPVLLPQGADIEALEPRLRTLGIETRRWYWPLACDMPAFARCSNYSGLEVSRSISRRLLGLPFFSGMTEGQMRRVIDGLHAALALNHSGGLRAGAEVVS